MRITRYTDYALRILIYLAVNPDNTGRIADIAKVFGVSRNHMAKVTNYLARTGYIKTNRGRGGGIKLAYPAKDIIVGEVIRDTEETKKIVDCWTPPCPLLPACELKAALRDAANAFLLVMDKYSIADLAKNKKPLLRLISPLQGRQRQIT